MSRVPARIALRLGARSLLLAVALLGCDHDTAPRAPREPGDPSDADVDTVPGHNGPWLREETAAPGSITFTELSYHTPGGDALDWIELHNPMALDMDLSGWALEGAVDYAFADPTVLPAGGYLVVAADPSRVPGARGPYTGALSDHSATLRLRNNSGRLIDIVTYGDDDPWPVEADGSGLTLAKRTPDAASDHAENWSASGALGGTPGAANQQDDTTIELVPMSADWTYDLSGAYPSDDWTSPDYDDSAWDEAAAIFYAGASSGTVSATITVTADNYYGVYLGNAAGDDLRWIGSSAAGDWSTVESFDADVGPDDHLYVAAWEASGDYGGPQMAIAEVAMPDDTVGTDAADWEWILGPNDGCPGVTPPDPAPDEGSLQDLIADGVWAAPGVDADRNASPWGWATGSAFTVARYIWADTFDDPSITNTSDTYALFRSRDPLVGPRGDTALDTVPTTATFRTTFAFDADPAAATLSVVCHVDDGVALYLNGVEVLRENLPAGTLRASTLASGEDDVPVYAELPTDALQRGLNVLSAEVHQATADDDDLTFGCSLSARVSAAVAPSVVLNEIAGAGESPYWVELAGEGASDGLVLASSAGGERVLDDGAVDGPTLVSDVGFPVAAGDVLFLYSADRGALLDAVRVGSGPRAAVGDAWRTPTQATPGAANDVEQVDDVVIHEIQYHRAPVSEEGAPVTPRDEEWIELYNRGDQAVDLGGWQLVDAVAYEFPAGTILAPGAYLVVAGDAASVQTAYPDIAVVGSFEGHLDNTGDRILLLDARGNPADEVRYADGGRWPAMADGGGASLELRDPRSDNAVAEAWSASDELGRSAWVDYRYRAEADPSAVGPDGAWNELVLGLLDAGTVLIDDVHVVEDPAGAAVDVVQDGGFDEAGAHWRLLGTHRRSAIVPDPDDPSNPVLRLEATGPTGHMHNHVETTLTRPIRSKPYDVSFRARWVAGSNQLNSRLYFNRAPHTTRVAMPDASGTPGAPNSTAVANAGPTFDGLAQDVAVPAAYAPVTLGVAVADPDGVGAVTLWSSVDGGAFGSQPMQLAADGRWQATLAGQAAGAIVQFYVDAEDALGAHATWPAAGADSRALLTFDDGKAATNGLHNFRILMTEADSDWILDDVNLMSDDTVGATVVYDESKVYYDVGVRAKGSERGRPEVARLGYGVSFHADQLFRGSHSSALVDRSEGVTYGQREVLMNLVMTHAGSVSGEYNDLIQAITPRAEHTGAAELQLDRTSDLVLDAQFEDGASGPLFEYELIYYPTTTDDGTAEGLKLPLPDNVIGTAITDLGDDAEAYRWNFLLQNNEDVDDYSGMIALGQAFARSDFPAGADRVIDVDQWLRAFAFATLSGAVDNYGGDGSQHNGRFYVRPEDGRVLYFPHDLDYYSGYGSAMPVVSNGDLARLLTEPAYLRAYYGHLDDIITRAFNPYYLAPWCDQLGGLLAGQDFASHCRFIADRADWVMYGASDSITARFPAVSFAVTTPDGTEATAGSVTLQGTAWIDVRTITKDGVPLSVTWPDAETFEVSVPVTAGPNTIELTALDAHGTVVGTDAVEVVGG